MDQPPFPPSIELSVTVAWTAGVWQARVRRRDRPEVRVFRSAEDLAAYLKTCRPAGLR